MEKIVPTFRRRLFWAHDFHNRKYDQLEDWMTDNKLVMNPEKTHLMVLGNKKSIRTNISVTARDCIIMPTESEKM